MKGPRDPVAAEMYVEWIKANRDPPVTDYEAPAKGDKQMALYAVPMLRLSSPGAHHVAAALIWHANSTTGRCDPGIDCLVFETELDRSTVFRALTELAGKGVLKRIRRRHSSTAYQLDWEKLRSVFAAFEARTKGWAKRKKDTRKQASAESQPCDSTSRNPATPGVATLPPEPIEGEPMEKEPSAGTASLREAAPSFKMPAVSRRPAEGSPLAGEQESLPAGKNIIPRGSLYRRAAEELGPGSDGLITKALKVTEATLREFDCCGEGLGDPVSEVNDMLDFAANAADPRAAFAGLVRQHSEQLRIYANAA